MESVFSKGDTSFSELRAERIHLRRMLSVDIPAFQSYRSDPDIARYQSWEPCDFGPEQASAFVNKQKDSIPAVPGEWIQLTIALNSSDESVGDVAFGVDAEDARLIEVGVTVAAKHQQCGYAREALQRLLNYLFLDLGKHRVCATVDPRNAASVALFRRLGFRQEAHFLEHVFFKGHWGDTLTFAMLNREFKQSLLGSVQSREVEEKG